MVEKLFAHINPSELIQLYDFIPDIRFWIKDRNSVFLSVNKAFLDNYALQEQSEVIGKSDFDFSPYYIAEQFVLDDKAVIEGKVVENRIELVSRGDKSISWCITTKRQVTSKTGEIIGTMGISRRISNEDNPEIPIYRLSEIVKYIHDNIHLPINISKMSEIMNCSISTLERTFRKLLHASPVEFIRKIKMQIASKNDY